MSYVYVYLHLYIYIFKYVNHDCKCLFPWNRCSETHSFTLSFLFVDLFLPCSATKICMIFIFCCSGQRILRPSTWALSQMVGFGNSWCLFRTQWKTVRWVVFFLTSKSTSSMFGRAFSGGIDWCTPREFSFLLRGPLRVRVFAKSLRIKVLWYIISLLVLRKASCTCLHVESLGPTKYS